MDARLNAFRQVLRVDALLVRCNDDVEADAALLELVVPVLQVLTNGVQFVLREGQIAFIVAQVVFTGIVEPILLTDQHVGKAAFVKNIEAQRLVKIHLLLVKTVMVAEICIEGSGKIQKRLNNAKGRSPCLFWTSGFPKELWVR